MRKRQSNLGNFDTVLGHFKNASHEANETNFISDIFSFDPFKVGNNFSVKS